MTQRRTGTHEWSSISVNCQIGCKHNCLYCYARAGALRRRLIKTPEEWKTPRKRKTIDTPYRLPDGRIMTPSTHDVCPENVDLFISIIRPWLELGNEVLIVSKPHLEVIKRLCDDLTPFKGQITFRFTIGSIDQDVLDFWERDAPPFLERLNCLKYTFLTGWNNSVSGEPFLDDAVYQMVNKVESYTNGTIWIGKMNDIENRVITTKWSKEDFKYLERVQNSQTDSEIKRLYDALKGNPKIRWKDSIAEVLGLPQGEIG